MNLSRLEERVNVVNFLRLNETEQSRIYKGCINKRRLENLGEVVKALVKKFNETDKALNFYKCDTCGGFHLTGSGKRRRRTIKNMIIKLKNK